MYSADTDKCFTKFKDCNEDSFVDCLHEYKDKMWNLGSFHFLLQEFSRNTEITKQETKCELLTRSEYVYKDKPFTFNFVDGLISKIKNSRIGENTCQNIANIINNSSKVGLTKEFYGNEFVKEVVALINKIFDPKANKNIKKPGYNFIPQEIGNTINGLAKLKYTSVDLKGLNFNFKALKERINETINNFMPQNIANTFNGLAQLEYTSADLEGLKLKELMSRINKLVEINNDIIDKQKGKFNDEQKKLEFKPQEISNTIGGLSQLGYKKEDLSDLNIGNLIQLINKKIKDFNSQDISLMLNGLSKLGYKKEDLEGLKLKELVSRINELVEINNDIIDKQKGKVEFIPQHISNILNSLPQLGYTSEELKSLELDINGLIELINAQIETFNPQNIANIINGLAQLGYTSADLKGLKLEELIQRINNQINNFNSQDIANTFNGLAQLGYTSADLKGLKLKKLMSRINELVKINNDTINKQKKFEGDLENLEFKPQNISLTLNGLAQLGYKKEQLKDLGLNFKDLIELIKKTIEDFKQLQDITNTLHGLGKIGYKFYDFEESNIIPNLLKKFNNIQQKDKTILNYLILMKGLMDIIYDHKQTLTNEQKQYLNELKKTINGYVKQIVKEAVKKYKSEIKKKRKTSKEKENLVDLKEKLTKFEGLEKKGWVKTSDFKSQSKVQKEQKSKESIHITFDETDTKEQKPEESINITFGETDTKEQKQEKQKQKQQEELEQLKQDKQKLKEEQQQLETEKENLESRQEQLKLDRQTIETIRDELKLKQQQLKEGQDKLLNDTTQLKLEQQQLETDKENLESRQQQLKKDRKELKSEQQQLKEGQDKLLNDTTQLESRQQQLEKDKEELKLKQQQLKEDRKGLNSEQTQLKEGQDKLKKGQKKLEKKEKDLELRQEQLEKKGKDLESRQEQLKLERQTIEAMRNELKLKEATERCKNAGFILLSTVGVMAAINKAFTNAVGTVLK